MTGGSNLKTEVMNKDSNAWITLDDYPFSNERCALTITISFMSTVSDFESSEL